VIASPLTVNEIWRPCEVNPDQEPVCDVSPDGVGVAPAPVAGAIEPGALGTGMPGAALLVVPGVPAAPIGYPVYDGIYELPIAFGIGRIVGGGPEDPTISRGALNCEPGASVGKAAVGVGTSAMTEVAGAGVAVSVGTGVGCEVAGAIAVGWGTAVGMAVGASLSAAGRSIATNGSSTGTSAGTSAIAASCAG